MLQEQELLIMQLLKLQCNGDSSGLGSWRVGMWLEGDVAKFGNSIYSIRLIKSGSLNLRILKHQDYHRMAYRCYYGDFSIWLPICIHCPPSQMCIRISIYIYIYTRFQLPLWTVGCCTIYIKQNHSLLLILSKSYTNRSTTAKNPLK